MSDTYVNEPHLFKNFSAEVKEPINGLVLTDDETRIIAVRRKEMWKVVKEIQIELREFESIWWYKYLKEHGAKEENELHRHTISAIKRKINEKCFEEYGFYLIDVLKSRTQTSVHLEDIYKTVMQYKKNGKPVPPSKEAEYHIKINDILSGNIKDFEEFMYNGVLIYEIPDEELPYTGLVEKKYDQRLWLKYRWMINKYLIKLRQKEAGHQRPRNNYEVLPIIPQEKTLLKSNRPIDNFIDTEQRSTFKKLRQEKCKAHIRENLVSMWKGRGGLGYRRRNIRW